MCYIICYMSAPERVGIRELRQNLSVYLRRVKKGHTLEVTERGKTVARFGPPATGSAVLDRLVAEGKARPATRDFRTLGPPPPARGPLTGTEALEEQREERLP